MESRHSRYPSEEFQEQKAKLLREPAQSPYDRILDKLDSTRRAIERIGKVQTSQSASGVAETPSQTYEGVCQQLEDARDTIAEQNITIK